MPEVYVISSVIFFGCMVFAVLQFGYTYYQLRRRDILSALLVACSALLYTGSVFLAVISVFCAKSVPAGRIFIIVRELAPLVFLSVIPDFLGNVLFMKSRLYAINRFLVRAGVFMTGIFVVAILLAPDLLVSGINSGDPARFITGIYAAGTAGPLALLRNVMLILLLLYGTGLMLYSDMQGESIYPVRILLVGIICTDFIIFYHVFISFFTFQSGSDILPLQGLAMITLIFFLSCGAIKTFVNYYRQLLTAKRDLKAAVFYDTSMGIPNREAFIRDLDSVISRAGIENHSVTLLIIDIDNFQNLNENYGETVGDGILSLFVKRYKELFEWMGEIYRIGGDDFAVILNRARSQEEVDYLVGRIIASTRNPFVFAGSSYTITVSIGILRVPGDGDDTDTVLKNAYSVLRRAKISRNTFTHFTKDLATESDTKIHTVNILRNSIDRDFFNILYQPIVDRHENLVFLEALLRCTHPDRPPGGPGTFIPLLEGAGMAREVDSMVISKAFHDMELYIGNRFGISINMSADQLINTEYTDFIEGFADQHGIEHNRVIFEATENILMANLELSRNNIENLRKKSFNFAIDDFGTGFSSLSYLAELPVDMIKIDMAFVRDVPGNSKKESLARHIVELAHSLDLKVIAEGFEMREQFEFFRELGCDLFQGYLFSRPDEIEKILSRFDDR